MSAKRSSAAIPDLDDVTLAEQLAPLKAMLPGSRQALPDSPPPSLPPALSAADPVGPPAPSPAAAEELQTLPRPVQERRPRKGIEFLLPEPIVTEIKTRAAQRGVSATILLLGMLRDVGYPVLDEDFLDLRKTPRR